MYQVKIRVIKNEEVAKGYYKISLESPEVANNSCPGQFVMVKAGGTNDPLLRRPFSIHRVQDEGIEILYRTIGKGTGMMAHIKMGEEVDIIGPLGRGFRFKSDIKEAVIVGGGIGSAPMLALVDALKQSREPGAGSRTKRNVVVFLGGRSKGDILCADEFRKAGADVQIATDDGSLGHKGFVTELLENYLSSHSSLLTSHSSLIFSCGPHLMSRKVAEISNRFNVSCQVSLETHMACGVGACLGCVIKTKRPGVRDQGLVLSQQLTTKAVSGCGCDSEQVPCDTQLPETSYMRVCVEGPVFDAEEVVWD